MWYIIDFAGGVVLGFVFGMFFFRNNKAKMTEMTDTISNLRDQLKKKKRK